MAKIASARRRALLKRKFVKSSPVLKLISGGQNLVLPGNLGKRLIFEAGSVFNGFFDPNFLRWGLTIEEGRRRKTKLEVYEVARKRNKRNFVSLFGSLERDFYRMCLTQNQIVSFAKNLPMWLPKDARIRTFFLFKVNGECYVAEANWGSDCLSMKLHLFLDYGSTYARYRDRLVVPQLNHSVA